MTMKEKMYSVAIRRRINASDHFWQHDDYEFIECKIDTCGDRYWFADPFLFEKDGTTYLFFEAFDLVERKGKEGYSILREDGTWSPLKIIINEKYHLSFPNIFEYDGKIYIMPEMSEDYSLKLYEAVSFPNEWKITQEVLPDIYACDSVFIEKKGSKYLLTNEMYHNVPNGQYASCWVKNYLYPMNGLKVVGDGVKVADGDYGIRNAGKTFISDSKLYRIGQDCCDRLYGRGMVLFEITSLNPYNEVEVKSWNCEEIAKHICTSHNENIIGSHTYNFSEHYEVIDFSSFQILSTRVKILRKWHNVKRNTHRILDFAMRCCN